MAVSLMLRRITLLSAALTISPQAAMAQQDSPVLPQGWTVAWKDNYCTISTGGNSSAKLTLRMLPGSPDPDVWIVGSRAIVPYASRVWQSGTTVNVTLSPNGQRFNPLATEMTYSEPRVVWLTSLHPDFAAAFAASNGIRIEKLGRSVSIPTAGADQAMAALRRCLDAHLAAWGINVKAYSELRMPPNEEWAAPIAYPRDALKQGAEAEVVTKIEIDASGRVRSCAVVSPSRWPSLDEAACGVAVKSGFSPAIGSDGKPTSAQRTFAVAFRLNHDLTQDRQFKCWQTAC